MSRSLAHRVLVDLARRHPVVLLHGEEDLLAGRLTSDIDCAVASHSVTTVVAAAIEAGRTHDLRLVSVWPYDCRGLALFLSTPDLAEIVQVDVLADARGIGKYGLRTDPLVRRARETPHGWLRPEPLDEVLYLLSKRTLKGQSDRVAQLRTKAVHHPAQAIEEAATTLLAPHARGRVLRALQLAAPSLPVRAGDRLARAVAEVRRLVQRLRHPVGAWIHVVVPPGDRHEPAQLLGRDRGAGPDPAFLRSAGLPGSPLGRARLRATTLTFGATVTVGPRPEPRATASFVSDGRTLPLAEIVDLLASRASTRVLLHR